MRPVLRFSARPSTILLVILGFISIAVSIAVVHPSLAATIASRADAAGPNLEPRVVASRGLKLTAFHTLKAEVSVPAPFLPAIADYRLTFLGSGAPWMEGTVAYAGCIFGKSLKVQVARTPDQAIEADFPASDPILQECIQRRAAVFIQTDPLTAAALMKAKGVAEAIWRAPRAKNLVTVSDLHIPGLEAANLQQILTSVARGSEVRLVSTRPSRHWDVAATSAQPLTGNLELLIFEPLHARLGTSIPTSYVQCPACLRKANRLKLRRGAWMQWEFSLRPRSDASPIVDVNLSSVHTKGAVSVDAVLVQNGKQCRVSLDDFSANSSKFHIALRPGRYSPLCGISRPTLVTITVYANSDHSEVAGTPGVRIAHG